MRSRVFHSEEPAADVEFCLVFPRESLSVPVMRRVLGDTLRSLGVDERCISDLLLAVTEACTNVLRHAGPGHDCFPAEEARVAQRRAAAAACGLTAQGRRLRR